MRARLVALTIALLAIWPGAVLASGGVTYRDVSESSLSSNPIVPGGVHTWAAVQEMYRRGTAQNSLLALRGRWLGGQTSESIAEHRWVCYTLAARVLGAARPEDIGAELVTFTTGDSGSSPYQPLFAVTRTTADLYGMTYWRNGLLMACMGRVAFRNQGLWRGWSIPVYLPDGRAFRQVVWEGCGNSTLEMGTKARERVAYRDRVEYRDREVVVEVPGPERVREVKVEVPVYVTEYRDREVEVKVPGPERVEYRDRVVCQEKVVCAPPTLTGPRGTTPTRMLRSGWTEPTFQTLVTAALVLVPRHAPPPAKEQPPPEQPCPPGQQPPVNELPPGVEPPPETVPVPLEPNPPGPPPVTGPGSGGEVGTNTPVPSTPTPGNSTVPAGIPDTPPDTTGLLPPG